VGVSYSAHLFLVVGLIQKPPGTKPLERGSEILGQINYFCLQRDVLNGRILNAKIQILLCNLQAPEKGLRTVSGKKGAKSPVFFFLLAGRAGGGGETPNSFASNIFLNIIRGAKGATQSEPPSAPLPFVVSTLTGPRGGRRLEFSAGAHLKRARSCNVAKTASFAYKIIISRRSVLGNNQVSMKNTRLYNLSFRCYTPIYTMNSTV